MPIKITTKKIGFRRCGVAFTGTAEYPDGKFTKDQIAVLQKEPNLVVEILPPGPDDKKTK
jgi:hypothetical protein